MLFVLTKGVRGEKYNVQGEAEVDNLEIAKFVAKELGKELKYTMHDNPGSRPGHDLRYSMDGTKLRDMGWKLPLTFEESLRRCIKWTIDNPSWLDQETFMHMPIQDDTPLPQREIGAGVKQQLDAFNASKL